MADVNEIEKAVLKALQPASDEKAIEILAQLLGERIGAVYEKPEIPLHIHTMIITAIEDALGDRDE